MAAANWDLEKQQILRHPLFPLLSMLFEKCEAATANIDKVTTTRVFNAQMAEFVAAMKSSWSSQSAAGSLVSGNDELDNLMVKAIQVLRIHLLELEKVHELCLDFCSRYISSIRTKLNSHILLKGDDSDSDYDYDLDMDTVPTPLSDSSVTASGTGTNFSQDSSFTKMSLPERAEVMVHGRTPFSHIGSSSASLLMTSNTENTESKGDYLPVTSKRGVLPKHATEVMKSWLFKHVVHPYPTEEEKKSLSQQTSLSILQVNNWFINARRRILQPMLESCSPLEQSKSRKCKPQIRQAQRFWPFTPSDGGSGGGSSCLSDNKVLTNSMTSAANLTDHDTRDFTPDKSPVIAQSPMLSEAGGNASPTLLQTNFIASNSNSDGGESVTESHSHSLPVTSDVMSSQSAPGSSLPSSGKLETELDPVD